MATYFTSDTHFGHEALIRHCFRDFSNIQVMDADMIRQWNARVGRNDTVWHLGDFTLLDADYADFILRQLNGNIHLIWGNHDRNSVRRLDRWVSSDYAREISLDGYRITLCHYAMRVWNQCGRGALMLHGHSHGNLPANSQSLDVGVDAWGFQPVTLQEILTRLQEQPTYRAEDHHTPNE